MRATRMVLAALAAGLLLRLAFGLLYWQDEPLTHDEQEYLALAANLAAGRGFVRDLPGMPEGPSVETFARAPLYPVFLAGVFLVTGHPTDRVPDAVPGVVQAAQAFVALITVWLVARFAARAAGPSAGAIAAWLAALHPPLVWSGAYALSEVVYSPLVLGGAWLAATAADGQRPSTDGRPVATTGAAPRRLAAAGIVLGLASLTRSAALVFVALLVLWLVARRRGALAVAVLLGACLVVAPWTLRNALVHDRLVVVAADGGITFWTGNHPLAIGEGDMAANPAIKVDHARFRETMAHLSPEAREPHYYRAALAHIADHPVRAAALVARKFFYTWVPIGPSYTLHSPRYYWATVVTYIPLLVMALLALPHLARARARPWTLGLLVASSVLLNLVFFPQERFRLPVVDPVLCVAAAAWLSGRLSRAG